MTALRVVLVGGPSDGDELTVEQSSLWRGVRTHTGRPRPGQVPPSHLYHLEVRDGQPAIDQAGRYRLTYHGTS